MNNLYLQLIATALLTAAACALPGTFLVLQGTSFMSDALGHAILLGIVLSFFIIGQLYWPYIMIGATLVGIATVAFIQLLITTKRIRPDGAIGIVFPLQFSIAVLLINLFASSIHLDIDAVFLGELAFTPLHQLHAFGYCLGSYAIWQMSCVLLLNALVIKMLYRPLMITTFDADFATSCRLKPHLIQYVLMTLTCITIVTAFECVGAILVVAFMIIPPATAYLITNRLSHMLMVSILLGMIGAVSGCTMANIFNVSIAGSIATMHGACFTVVLLLTKRFPRIMLPHTR